MLLIISSIAIVRASDGLSFLLFLARSSTLVAILLLWLLNSTVRLKANKIALIFGAFYFPYLLTDARMAYLDVLTLLIMAAILEESPSREGFLNKLAFVSLGLAITIAALAWLSVLPSISFEWKDRVKNSMGFANPNTFFYYLLSSAFAFFTVRNRIGFNLCGLLILGLFGLVGGRTFLIGYLLLLGTWLQPNLLKKPLITSMLWSWLLLALATGYLIAIFPLQLSLLISTLTGLDINEITSNRLDFLSESANRSTMQLLFGGLENNADSLYVYLLNGFGIINLPVFVYALTSSISREVKRNNPTPLVLACVFFTIGIFEAPLDGSALIALVFVLAVFFRSPPNKDARHRQHPAQHHTECPNACLNHL